MGCLDSLMKIENNYRNISRIGNLIYGWMYKWYNIMIRY